MNELQPPTNLAEAESSAPNPTYESSGEAPSAGQGKVDDKFDFAKHEQTATTAYLKVRAFYADMALANRRIVEEALKKRNIQVHSVQAREKDPNSFARKAAKPTDSDPLRPKYSDPLSQMTDLAAIRIITFFPRTITDIDRLLKQEFQILEQFNKGDDLLEEEKFGYQSVHYLIRMTTARSVLPEYERFRDAVTEVQVRTILQHAWAEIEHDIQYKSSSTIPRDIKRRFMALAGLLEMADREFQAIQDADRELNVQAVSLVDANRLDGVELTPHALKLYLDKKLGADGRMSEYSYDWTTRLLKRLGFLTLQQVDQCIRPYNDNDVSMAIAGYRQGQLTRFEYLLLAGMGETFIKRHLFADESWFPNGRYAALEKLRAARIPIGNTTLLTSELALPHG